MDVFESSAALPRTKSSACPCRRRHGSHVVSHLRSGYEEQRYPVAVEAISEVEILPAVPHIAWIESAHFFEDLPPDGCISSPESPTILWWGPVRILSALLVSDSAVGAHVGIVRCDVQW